MKVLIINPPDQNTVIEHPDEQGEGFLEADDFGNFPPLGALYVLSYLEKHRPHDELVFLDCIGEKVSQEELGKRIAGVMPDVIGITSFTISMLDVCIAARTAREIAPSAHICLGGHHPIAWPYEAAQLPEFDSIVVGEGEVAFTELVTALEERRLFTEILGVYTKDSIARLKGEPTRDNRFLSKVIVPPAYIEDVDSLVIPNRRFIRHIKYHNILGVTGDLATILSSRGCPYLCTFCDVPYKRYRPRNVDLVLDEVEQCMAMGYKEFRFYDDLFNINPKKVIDFCDAIDRRGLDFAWDFRGRVNGVNQESLVRARDSGLRMIAFGVETGSDLGLKLLKKATTTQKIEQAFNWCRELGILTVADFIIGHSFEKTKADIRNNIDFLINLDPDYAQISILTLYPGTALFDEAEARGLVDSDRWRKWAKNPYSGMIVDHWEENMSLAELLCEQKRAYRRFYFRLKYIYRSAMKTRSKYELQSKVNGALKLLRTNYRLA
jgi:anaerobic magnesium-protoporphyrin IX monomethyl ester cyclase